MKRFLARDWYFILVFILVFLGVPIIWGSSYYLDVFNLLGIYSIVIMGLILVSGFTGQISMGHNAFFGLGGYGTALLTVKLGYSPYVGLLAGLLGALIIGYMVALASLRVRGYYLAITTMVLGWVIWSLTIAFPEITGGSDGIWDIPNINLKILTLQTNFQKYFLIWGLTLAIFIFSLNIGRSKIGRTLKAIHSNEILSETSGINAARYKIHVMLYSAAVTALAGFLMAHYRNEFGPPIIEPSVGIDFLIMMFLGGVASIPGAFIGVGLMKLLPEFFEALQIYKTLAYGVIMIFILMFLPEGMAGGLIALGRKIKKRVGVVDFQDQPVGAIMPQEIPNITSTPISIKANANIEPFNRAEILVSENLCKNFGGIMAVSNLSFSAKQGTIKAIIGPNGAGKSTFFRIINSVIPGASGKNLFKGKNTIELKPFEVTALGLCMTFQTPRLFDNLSILENVMVGCHMRTKTSWLQGAILGSKTQQKERWIREISLDLLAFMGLKSQVYRKPGELPYAQRKFVDIARALATQPDILCLDEPASGLTETEKEKLMMLIEHINRCGITILLVEHDMNFVMNLSNEVMVMNFGQKIAEGFTQRNKKQ